MKAGDEIKGTAAEMERTAPKALIKLIETRKEKDLRTWSVH